MRPGVDWRNLVNLLCDSTFRTPWSTLGKQLLWNVCHWSWRSTNRLEILPSQRFLTPWSPFYVLHRHPSGNKYTLIRPPEAALYWLASVITPLPNFNTAAGPPRATCCGAVLMLNAATGCTSCLEKSVGTHLRHTHANSNSAKTTTDELPSISTP